MKYVVEVIYGDRNEWSEEEEYYGDALNYALAMSELQGVSETRIWYEDEIVDTIVDGIIQDMYGEERWDDWDDEEEPYDPFDEVGYDPYTGGYDMDL